MNPSTGVPLYRARLGSGALVRGDRVICEVLDWEGASDALVRVRIVHSTVGSIRTGHVGLVPRARLVPADASA